MKKIIISFMIVFAAVSLQGFIVNHYSAEIVVALLVACLLWAFIFGAYYWKERGISSLAELEREKQATLDKRNEQVSIAMNGIMRLALGLFEKKKNK